MDQERQIKIMNLIQEQAWKLAEAIKALREIRRLGDGMGFGDLQSAVDIAEDTLQRISDYGKHSEDI